VSHGVTPCSKLSTDHPTGIGQSTSARKGSNGQATSAVAVEEEVKIPFLKGSPERERAILSKHSLFDRARPALPDDEAADDSVEHSTVTSAAAVAAAAATITASHSTVSISLA